MVPQGRDVLNTAPEESFDSYCAGMLTVLAICMYCTKLFVNKAPVLTVLVCILYWYDNVCMYCTNSYYS